VLRGSLIVVSYRYMLNFFVEKEILNLFFVYFFQSIKINRLFFLKVVYLLKFLRNFFLIAFIYVGLEV